MLTFDLWHRGYCDKVCIYRNMYLWRSAVSYQIVCEITCQIFCNLFWPFVTLTFDLLTSQSWLFDMLAVWNTCANWHENQFTFIWLYSFFTLKNYQTVTDIDRWLFGSFWVYSMNDCLVVWQATCTLCPGKLDWQHFGCNFDKFKYVTGSSKMALKVIFNDSEISHGNNQQNL